MTGTIIQENPGPACLGFRSCMGLNAVCQMLCMLRTCSWAFWATSCCSRTVRQSLGHLEATSASKAPLYAWESAARYNLLEIILALVVNWGCKMNNNLRKWNKLLVFLYSSTMLTSWQLGACITSAPITTVFAPNSARKSKLNLQVWATFVPSFHEVSPSFSPASWLNMKTKMSSDS